MEPQKVVYAERPDGPLSLNVFKPVDGVDRSTAVLHVHGGGWRAGVPEMLTARSLALAALGYTVIQVQYRLLTDTVRWPAPVVDLRSALRWVSTHADELGVDREKLVLWGHSAGAHISLMTACQLDSSNLDDPGDDTSVPVSVAAVIDCYGPVQFHAGDIPLLAPGPDGLPDLTAIAANQRSDGALPGIDLLGAACSEEQAQAISPLRRIKSDFPPTMIAHGTADTLMIPAASHQLDSTLTALGVTSQLVTFAGCNHEFDAIPSYARVLTAHIDLFLRRVFAEAALAAEISESALFPEPPQRAASHAGA